MRIASRRLRLGVLVVTLGLGLTPAGNALTCDWTGAASTDWNDPANWSNCGGGVPGSSDTAVITNTPNQPSVFTTAFASTFSLGPGSLLTVESGGNLNLNGTATGAGNITVEGTLTWNTGTMSGTGVTTIAPGGTLELLHLASKTLSRNLVNNGTVTTTVGASSLIITAGATFSNLGLFDISNGSEITGDGTFQNSVLFRSSSPGTASVTVATWLNSGLVQVQTGVLSIGSAAATHGGTYDFSGTRLILSSGVHTVTALLSGSVLEMNGQVAFSSEAALADFVTTIEIGGPVSFDTGAPIHATTLLLLAGAHVSGADNLSALNCNWYAGTLTGTGTFAIPEGGTWEMDGSGARTLDRDTSNEGTAVMVMAAGSLVIPPGRTLVNEPTGSFTIQNDALIGGEGVFSNLGLFRRMTSAGTATVDLDFRNAGDVSLESGSTIFHEYLQTAGTTDLNGGNLGVVHELVELEGGSLTGEGVIDASVEASGDASLGNIDALELTITGGYRQSPDAVLAFWTIAPAFPEQLEVAGPAVLGGKFGVTIFNPPIVNASYSVMTYASRVGRFTIDTVPTFGFTWVPRYRATDFSIRLQALVPGDVFTDFQFPSGGVSNSNTVFEPGEQVVVAGQWSNPTANPITVTGIASNFTGPAGATYTIVDATADYGTIAANAVAANCLPGGDCLELAIDDPPTRPAAHWDATFDETLSNTNVATWTVHIGNSFPDVPHDPFYPWIETLFHNHVTAGCGGGNYCPNEPVTRAQMAVFLLVSRFGVSYLPPDPSGTLFSDLPPGSFAAAFIEDMAARGVTAGCGGGNFCPGSSATREQMAVFLLRALEGPTYVPPDCTTPTFTDVPCSSPFAKWIEELVQRGVTAGCGSNTYCPADPVTRSQMAVFLSLTFGLRLNGG